MRSIPRLAVAAAALGAMLPLATSAHAATAPTTAAGDASSAATLVSIAAFGQTLSLGTLTSSATTIGTADALVELVPATVNGAKSGTVSVSPASSPKDVAATSTSAVGALPAGLLAASSPAARLFASVAGGEALSGMTGNLGRVQLLGTDLLGASTASVTSAVQAGGSSAGKVVALRDVGLPSLSDILIGLGVDLSALPLDTVRDLLRSLPGTLEPAIEALMTAAETVQSAVDSAQAAVTAAQAEASTAEAAVTTAAAQLTQADAAVATATSAVNTALAAANLTQAGYDALAVADRPGVVTAAISDLTSAQSAADAAAATLSAARAAAAAAQAGVDAAQAALDAALAALRAAITAVLEAAAGVLDVPLASIASATVESAAKVGSDATTRTADVTGSISGLKVLGADVLALAGLGSTVDVIDTASAAVAQINAQAAGVLGSVFGTLNGAVPGLQIPTPTVEFLTKRTATGSQGEFGTARAAVNALTIGIGAFSIPTAVALPALPTIPGVTQSTGAFSTAPIDITIGQLTEAARFRPASAAGAPIGAPGTSLPRTGAPAGVALAALLLTGLAFAAHRRTAGAQV